MKTKMVEINQTEDEFFDSLKEIWAFIQYLEQQYRDQIIKISFETEFKTEKQGGENE